MSNTGSKMDVEDVLASIRRLVSEEARSTHDEEGAPATAPESVEKPDAAEPFIAPTPEKLILTPAFRVAEQKMPGPDPSEIQKRIADIETLVLSEVESVDAQRSTESESLETEPTEAQNAEVLAESSPEAAASEETTSEPELAEPEALSLTAAHIVRPVVPNFEPEVREEPLEDLTPESVATDDVDGAADSETAIIPPASNPSEPATLHKISESGVFTSSEPEVGYQGGVDFTADSEPFLDEEALREIVSEMVRSELQGELGDRITRNVRKLVRREIHRALASRDFE